VVLRPTLSSGLPFSGSVYSIGKRSKTFNLLSNSSPFTVRQAQDEGRRA
jgi:hypothetical protein